MEETSCDLAALLAAYELAMSTEDPGNENSSAEYQTTDTRRQQDKDRESPCEETYSVVSTQPDNRTYSREDQTTDTGRQQDKERESPCEKTCSVVSTQPDNGTYSREDQTTDTGRQQDKERENQCEETCSEESTHRGHICDHCGYTTSRQANLSVHMKKHTGGNPYHLDQSEKTSDIDETNSIEDQLTDAEWQQDKERESLYDSEETCSVASTHSDYGTDKLEKTDKPSCDFISTVDHHDPPYKEPCNKADNREDQTADQTAQSYRCRECDHVASSQEGLKVHFLDKHVVKRAKPHMCWCGFRTAHSSHLLVHMTTHTGERTYNCNQCDFSTLSEDSLEQHMATHSHTLAKVESLEQHSGNKANKREDQTTNQAGQCHRCSQCSYTASSQEGLKAHMACHLLKCDICNFCTMSLQDLEQHVSQQHLSTPAKKPYIYSCEQCNFGTDYKSQLSSHIKSLHTADEYPYKCDQCSYAATQKHFLDKHMLKHEKPHVCWCGFRTDDASHLRVHMTSHTGERAYRCGQCDFSTLSEDGLEQHRETHSDVSTSSKVESSMEQHSGSKPYLFSCVKCEFRTNDRSLIYTHMITHTEKKTYKCDQCGYATRMKNFLDKHMLKHRKPHLNWCGFKTADTSHLLANRTPHTAVGERTYKGDQCDFSTSSEDSSEQHRATHSDTLGKDKSLEQHSSLEDHKATHSGKDNHHACGECEFTTNDRVILSMHVNEHTGEAPKIGDHTSHNATHSTGKKDYHICAECGYMTADRVILSMHLSEHTGKAQNACWDHTYALPPAALSMNTVGKPYLCEECGFSTMSMHHLTIHKRRHTGEKPYLCDICGLTFVDKTTLTVHKRRKHAGEKPYKCDLCDYSAAQKNCLDLHMANKHTGEKPYVCQLCGFRTALKGYISIHMRTHTGDKPYKCDYCDFTAAQRHSINLHMATHDPTKYLVCEECGMRTVSKQYLKRHMAKHEKDPHYRYKPYRKKRRRDDDYDYDDDDDDDDEEEEEEEVYYADYNDDDNDDVEQEENKEHYINDDLFDFYGAEMNV